MKPQKPGTINPKPYNPKSWVLLHIVAAGLCTAEIVSGSNMNDCFIYQSASILTILFCKGPLQASSEPIEKIRQQM